MLAVALLVTSSDAVPPSEQDADALSFAQALREMHSVGQGLRDATFTMYSREWVGGSRTALTVTEVKFRAPEDAYLVFTEGPNKGRELLWRGPSWNHGKFKVDPGRFLPVLNLSPTGSMAMRGNRHSIRELPPTILVEKIIADARRIEDSPTFAPEVQDLGVSTVRGEASHCWEAKLPKDEDPAFYAVKVRMCANPETHMPNSMRIWDVEDGALRLVEEYDYIGLRVNPGLTDEDFDPDTYGL